MNLPVLETSRLILRPLEDADVADFFKMNDNPNISKYLRNPLRNIAETEKYIAKIKAEYIQNGIGRFAVVLKENNALIGFSGLKFRANEENGFADFYDIGYRFSEEYWGNGYAKEAAFAWMDYGFKQLKLEIIHACAEAENVASNHLLKHLGFQFTNSYLVNEVLHNWYKLENKLL